MKIDDKYVFGIFLFFILFFYIYIYYRKFNAEFNKLIKTVGHVANNLTLFEYFHMLTYRVLKLLCINRMSLHKNVQTS